MKFHESNISDVENDANEETNAAVPSASSLLEQYIAHVREALGVDIPTSQNNGALSETESEAGDLWNQQLEELGDRLNQVCLLTMSFHFNSLYNCLMLWLFIAFTCKISSLAVINLNTCTLVLFVQKCVNVDTLLKFLFIY